jgi:hypothetical protein
VEPQDIRNIIVTHFHPDHFAGLEQFLTIAFESKFPCDIFVGETGYSLLKAYQAERMKIHEITPGQIYRLAEYKDLKGRKEEITFGPFPTYHSEIGLSHRSLGLHIDINTPLNIRKVPYRITLLGDTDGRKEYLNYYIKSFDKACVGILHLGTYSAEGFGSGYGHLLAPGAKRLVTELFRRKHQMKEKSTNTSGKQPKEPSSCGVSEE